MWDEFWEYTFKEIGPSVDLQLWFLNVTAYQNKRGVNLLINCSFLGPS